MSHYLDMLAFMIGLVIRLASAAILAQSAALALRDPATHTAVVAEYRILPAAVAPYFAWVLPIMMSVIAFALLVPMTAPTAAVIAAALMAVFALAIWVNLARGRDHIDCGCGGAAGQRLSGSLVTRNVVLTVLLLSAAVAPVNGTADSAVVIGALGGTATLIGFYFVVNALINNSSIFRAARGGR